MFQALGYATCGVGKWHLGTVARFGATRNGFDQWLGIPYSNDNSKYHPVLSAEMPPLPFYDGEVVIETDPDQSQFTKRFTQRAVSFLEHHADQPFFLYMPHVMPHVPIFASRDFAGTSEHGLYGDVIQELDWSVGQILATLKRLEVDNNTLVIFFSDNGPWLSYGEHAGSATPLREGKLTTFEGGVRVPCLVRWPGKIPANRVNDEPFMSIDWLPTLIELVGGRPPNHNIDGLSVTPLLLGEPSANRRTKRSSSMAAPNCRRSAVGPGSCISRILTSPPPPNPAEVVSPRIGARTRRSQSPRAVSRASPAATADVSSGWSFRCSICAATPANRRTSPRNIQISSPVSPAWPNPSARTGRHTARHGGQ